MAIISAGALEAHALQGAEMNARHYRAAQLRQDRMKRIQAKKRRARQKQDDTYNMARDSILFLALALALFKDVLDLALIGSLPGIGTVITLLFSLTIIMIFMVHSVSAQRGRARKVLNRSGIIVGFSIVEGLLFGLNFLPLETIAVIVTYVMIRKDRRKEKKRAKQKSNKRGRGVLRA